MRSCTPRSSVSPPFWRTLTVACRRMKAQLLVAQRQIRDARDLLRDGPFQAGGHRGELPPDHHARVVVLHQPDHVRVDHAEEAQRQDPQR